jgi:hypothetical protein
VAVDVGDLEPDQFLQPVVGGAGPSVHFAQEQLPVLYQQMAHPVILGPAR